MNDDNILLNEEDLFEEEREDIEILGEEEAEKVLEKGKNQAKEILFDEEKLAKFLIRLEKKLRYIPKIGNKLAMVPIFASLVNDYARKRYTDAPLGTIVAVLSALIYFVSPLDIIPDTFPGLGHLDDAAVVTACWKLVELDVEEYLRWRAENE